MNRRLESPEVPGPDLFEPEPTRRTLPLVLRPQVAMLVKALLAEIAAALATGEAGDEQDHR
jgi:hypothetical protein